MKASLFYKSTPINTILSLNNNRVSLSLLLIPLNKEPSLPALWVYTPLGETISTLKPNSLPTKKSYNNINNINKSKKT